MDASVLIVSRNRNAELNKTLKVLENYLDPEKHEILVFLDGCTDGSGDLVTKFPRVIWEISESNLGASKARSTLFPKARGKLLFGFDDDAHPLQKEFVNLAETLFKKYGNTGIIAFKEIKGIYGSDEDIPEELKEQHEDFLVKDFLGCGFAMRREVYNKTRGFPIWIDIYGEEACVALETLELGYDILFTYQISVNHRTQKQKNNIDGAKYFRFGKQLKNTASFYLVYYPFPLLAKKIGRLYLLNFKKYVIKDRKFLREYIKALQANLFGFKKVLKYRKRVSKDTIRKFNELPNPKY